MLISESHKRIFLLILPVILSITCAFVFRQLANLFGNKCGYFFGFLFYWLFWCFFVPVNFIGMKSIVRLFVVKKLFTDWTVLICLLAPLIFVYVYAFRPLIRQENPEIIILSLLLSIVNATFEEVLWRAVYFKIFKHQKYLGIVASSVGFAIWHYAPQVVFTNSNPGGAHSFVIFALVLGLAYSFVVWKQQSIFWVTIAHILFDFGGLGARIYLG